MTEATPLAQALRLPIGLLAPSPTNPRKRFEAAALAELADSIAEHDVMTPLAARPNPAYRDGNGHPPYELVCGERRWRACRLLVEQERAYPGDGTVPVLVRDYTDAQVLALQALENVQRQDLHPMEEADHYHLMVTHPRHPATVAEVAQLIGKSASYVQARLNLRRLCPAARDAFMEGKLDFSKALRVSAMPAAQQPGIVQHITTWGGEPMGVRAAERFIVEQHTLLLRQAPWNLADPELVPEAGACTDCGHRTDRQPGLFETVTDGDRCLDGSCWGRKRQAHHDWLVRNAEAEGYVIARGERAATILRPDSTVPADGWHDLSARVPAHLGDSTLTVEQVIDRAGVPAEDITVLDQPGRDRLVHLVTTAVLRTALTATGTGRQPQDGAEPPAAAPAAGGTAAAPAPAPVTPAAALANAISGPAPKAPAAPSPAPAPSWTPLDDMLAFQILPDGRCDDEMAKLCRERAIERTVTALAAHRVCAELRDRGPQLNALLPAASAGLINAALLELLDDPDELDATPLADIARLAGIATSPPQPKAGELESMHRQAMCRWATELERIDATCLAQALLIMCAMERWLPASTPWQHLCSAVGIVPDTVLADATAAVDERLRLELLMRSERQAQRRSIAKPAVKYRNAETGETWTGRGLQPKWLKAALAAGAQLSDFAVQARESSA